MFLLPSVHSLSGQANNSLSHVSLCKASKGASVSMNQAGTQMPVHGCHVALSICAKDFFFFGTCPKMTTKPYSVGQFKLQYVSVACRGQGVGCLCSSLVTFETSAWSYSAWLQLGELAPHIPVLITLEPAILQSMLLLLLSICGPPLFEGVIGRRSSAALLVHLIG